MPRAGSSTWFTLQCWSLMLVLSACAGRFGERSSSNAAEVGYAPAADLDLRRESLEVHAGQASAALDPRTPALAASIPAEPQERPAATDASPVRGPLLVYTANFQLSVFEVEKSQREAKAMALQLGGFVARQSQATITLRVPAPRFEEAVLAIERIGKVLSREIEALDVGERYRDLTLRLKTLEAMRARLEELLARAANVKEALEVEQQLERVLGEIELLKGQLRSLDDRIAYSTLTLSFTPTPQPTLDQGAVFRLPVPWLQDLGVHSLLEVTR